MKKIRFPDFDSFLAKQMELMRQPHVHFVAEFDLDIPKYEITVYQ